MASTHSSKWKTIVASLLVLIAASCVWAGDESSNTAQQSATLLAPAPILNGKTVFVSFGEGDSAGVYGDPSLPYTELRSALENWGHYTLVPSPSEADLIFEIHYSTPIVAGGYFAGGISFNRESLLKLIIIDPKTHTTLWWLVEHVDVPTGKKVTPYQKLTTLDAGISKLVLDVQNLIAAPVPALPTPTPVPTPTPKSLGRTDWGGR